MPECTPEERELLDSLGAEPLDSKRFEELRCSIAISRITAEQRRELVEATAEAAKATRRRDLAWKRVQETGVYGTSRVLKDLWDTIQAEAERVR